MFTITKRQYDMIMQQAQACFPEESGGVLGGRENVILGVLPVFNQHLYDRTKTFGMTADDIDRAYRFFEKNKMQFYGIYHSHPKGIPYPSKEDLSHGQRYLFIIGLADRYNPDLYAYEIVKGNVVPLPITIIEENMVDQLFLSADKHKFSDAAKPNDMTQLTNMINDMILGRLEYPKETPKWDSSSFSTTA
jgi:[CysO sulfur-carrier protein]-S-L-cysteine hydrolase